MRRTAAIRPGPAAAAASVVAPALAPRRPPPRPTRPTTLPAVLSLYVSGGAAARADAIAGAATLARAASLFDSSPATSRAAVTNDASLALLQDLAAHVRGGATVTRDGRWTASVVYSLSKLRSPLNLGPGTRNAGGASSSAASALAAACVLAATPRLDAFTPRSLAMLALGLARLGHTDKALFDAIAAVCARAGGHFPPAAVSMLATAFATARVDNSARAFTALSRHASPSLLRSFSNGALVSLVWAACTSIASANAAATRRAEGAEARSRLEGRLQLLHDIAEEATCRLLMLPEGGHSGSSVRGSALNDDDDEEMGERGVVGAGMRSTDLAGVEELTDPAARVALAMTRLRGAQSFSDDEEGDEEEGVGDSEGMEGEGARAMSAEETARLLYSYATANLRPPQLFAAAARALATPSPHHPRISLLPPRILASTAWALAHVHFESASTPLLWVAMQHAALPRIEKEIATLCSSATASADTSTAIPSSALDSLNGGTALQTQKTAATRHGSVGLRPGDMSTLSWAATAASVPSLRLCRTTLEHAAARPHAYTLPALAQVLWAHAVQQQVAGGEPAPLATRACLDYALALCDDARRRGRGGAPSSPLTDPDAFAASLLSEAPPGAASASRTLHRIQGQLFTALLALRLSPAADGSDATSRTAIAFALNAVPAGVQQVWRRAFIASQAPPSPSPPNLLHADIARVLTVAGLAHERNFATREGLVADFLLTADGIQDAGDAGDDEIDVVAPLKVREGRGTAAAPIVFDVQGPLHFTQGVQATSSLKRGAATTPRDAMLVGGGGGEWEGGLLSLHSGGGGEDARADALVRTLLPTLRAQAKASWLRAAGFRVVPIHFALWASRPSTQERLELLADVGVPVPTRLL